MHQEKKKVIFLTFARVFHSLCGEGNMLSSIKYQPTVNLFKFNELELIKSMLRV
jgi:hypothetical protein